jgi:natural product precursor
MKVISKLKLTQLSKAELSRREQNTLLGGRGCCLCHCSGSSGTYDNGNSNNAYGYTPGGGGFGNAY